jgi:adenine deaminase
MPTRYRRRLLRYICLSACLVACLASCANRPPPNAASTLVIVGGTIVHPQRDAARAVAPNSVIVVTDGCISAVGTADSVTIPVGATIMDARGKWIVPGLIDAHVHFFQSVDRHEHCVAASFIGRCAGRDVLGPSLPTST